MGVAGLSSTSAKSPTPSHQGKHRWWANSDLDGAVFVDIRPSVEEVEKHFAFLKMDALFSKCEALILVQIALLNVSVH